VNDDRADDGTVDAQALVRFFEEVSILALALDRFLELAERLYPSLKRPPPRAEHDKEA